MNKGEAVRGVLLHVYGWTNRCSKETANFNLQVIQRNASTEHAAINKSIPPTEVV
jgi:hypothetical protein